MNQRIVSANKSAKVMRHLFVIALFTHLFLSGNGSILACSCVDPLTPREELKKARAVFVGEVVEVEELMPSGKLTNDNFLYIVRFKVQQYWKGVKRQEILIHTNLPVDDCGKLYFEEGKQYLVYAFGKK